MSKSVFNISTDKKNDVTTIWIEGFIGESWYGSSTSAKDFIKQLEAIKTNKITVFINSRGGSVTDGIAIHNALASHSAEITTINASCAMSIASVILQAGNKRLAFKNAITMVHDCSSYAAGNAGSLRKQADVLDKFNELLAISYEEAGVSKEDIETMLNGEDHFYNASQAQDIGLIDDIVSADDISAMAEHPDLTPDYLTHQNATYHNKGIVMSKNNPAPEAESTPEKKASLLQRVTAMLSPEPETPDEPEQIQANNEEYEAALELMAQGQAEQAKAITLLQEQNSTLVNELKTLNTALNRDANTPRPLATGENIEPTQADI